MAQCNENKVENNVFTWILLSIHVQRARPARAIRSIRSQFGRAPLSDMVFEYERTDAR
jgi:hypothetical protein